MKKTKPAIGLTPLWDEKLDSLWMVPGYMDGVAEAGGIPVALPLTSDKEDLAQLVETFDGFLFTGGHDVDPTRYGEEPIAELGETCAARDAMEFPLAELALAANKPIFGICRGVQVINVALGGTLWQDLPSRRPSETAHVMTSPYDRVQHRVDLQPGSPLRSILGVESLGVNSYHHQAIRKLAPTLDAAAISEDGLVEAVVAPDRNFVWGVQWHPELSHETDPASKKLFKAFVDAARATNAKKP